MTDSQIQDALLPHGKFWKVVKTEDGQRLCVCPVEECGATFTRPYNLKSHYMQHLDMRPFQCKDCEKAFVRMNDLKRHARIHNPHKQFYCQDCNKTFSRKDALKRHQDMNCKPSSPGSYASESPSPELKPVTKLSLEFILN
ncbi:hypothetical protein EDD86DRAFT_185636 [Gorgonomyces haynaldii]|nr:hypothetical protein EDD86DRAFT_185636 [Gorgonomyces haynaldii]